MRKIIVVESGCGRVGSSALMGLLQLGNVDLGGRHSAFVGPSPHNKKGFFELKSFHEFLKENCKEYYPTIKNIPILYLEKVGMKHWRSFLNLIEKEFYDKPVIAFKSYKCLMFPLIENINKNTTAGYTKVIRLKRNVDDQAESIRKLWMVSRRVVIRRGWKVDANFIKESCLKWNNYVNLVYKRYSSFDYLTLRFEDLVERPLATAKNVFNFIEEKVPLDKEILEWLDKGITHIGKNK